MSRDDMSRDIADLLVITTETRIDVRHIKEAMPELQRKVHALELFRARAIGMMAFIVTVGLPVVGWFSR